jgi:hypothetical protein
MPEGAFEGAAEGTESTFGALEGEIDGIREIGKMDGACDAATGEVDGTVVAFVTFLAKVLLDQKAVGAVVAFVTTFAMGALEGAADENEDDVLGAIDTNAGGGATTVFPFTVTHVVDPITLDGVKQTLHSVTLSNCRTLAIP